MPEINRHAAYRDLLRTHVDAFEDLEILLEVTRDGYRPSGPADLAERLRMTGDQVSGAVERLTAPGLLQLVNGLVVLGPLDERTRIGLDELKRLADANRLQVMADMSTNAIERLRTGALRAFTRAFILKKDNDG
jgi:hypothetical protein